MSLPGPGLRLRPTLFGSQIDRVSRLLREGCSEHAMTLAGAPECSDCSVIQFWEPELRGVVGSINRPSGYVDRRIA